MRQIKQEVTVTWYDSESIQCSSYDRNNKKLILTFSTGKQYCYNGVPYKVFEQMRRCRMGIGRWVNKVFKPKNYKYEQY